MDFWDKTRKTESANRAELEGRVADSMDVRMSLMERVENGEISLSDAQKELKVIKRNASKNGKTTRAKAWNNG